MKSKYGLILVVDNFYPDGTPLQLPACGARHNVFASRRGQGVEGNAFGAGAGGGAFGTSFAWGPPLSVDDGERFFVRPPGNKKPLAQWTPEEVCASLEASDLRVFCEAFLQQRLSGRSLLAGGAGSVFGEFLKQLPGPLGDKMILSRYVEEFTREARRLAPSHQGEIFLVHISVPASVAVIDLFKRIGPEKGSWPQVSLVHLERAKGEGGWGQREEFLQPSIEMLPRQIDFRNATLSGISGLGSIPASSGGWGNPGFGNGGEWELSFEARVVVFHEPRRSSEAFLNMRWGEQASAFAPSGSSLAIWKAADEIVRRVIQWPASSFRQMYDVLPRVWREQVLTLFLIRRFRRDHHLARFDLRLMDLLLTYLYQGKLICPMAQMLAGHTHHDASVPAQSGGGNLWDAHVPSLTEKENSWDLTAGWGV